MKKASREVGGVNLDGESQAMLTQWLEEAENFTQDQIVEIVQQARQEALAEAKEILRGVMVKDILARVVEDCGNDAPLRQESEAVGEAHIRAEIEAVRRKIFENEQLLKQIKAPSLQNPPAMAGIGSVPGDDVKAQARGNGAVGGQLACESQGYYVYGIVWSDDQDGAAAGQPLPELPEHGIDTAYSVYSLPFQGIQAIVSQVSLQEFGLEVIKANLNDPAWLEAKVRSHQHVLESASAHRSIIPMKFCTIYLSEERIREMLDQQYDAFVEDLKRLAGNQEWGVKVYCDRKVLARMVEETCDRVKQLKIEAGDKSVGAAYFIQKKLAETVATQVERCIDENVQNIHDRLAACSQASIVNPVQSKEITGREDEMVLNGAYLVPKSGFEAFQAELDSHRKVLADQGFTCVLTGPWPPYNFVTAGFEGVAVYG